MSASAAVTQEKLDLLVEKLLDEQEANAVLREELARLQRAQQQQQQQQQQHAQVRSSREPSTAAAATIAAIPAPITAVVARRSGSEPARQHSHQLSSGSVSRLLSRQRELVGELRGVGAAIASAFASSDSRQAAAAPERISSASEAMLLVLRGASTRNVAAARLSSDVVVAESDPPLQLRAHWQKVKELLAAASGGAADNKSNNNNAGDDVAADITAALRVAVFAHDRLPAAHRVVHAAPFLAELQEMFPQLMSFASCCNAMESGASSDLALGLCFSAPAAPAAAPAHQAAGNGSRSRSVSPPTLTPRRGNIAPIPLDDDTAAAAALHQRRSASSGAATTAAVSPQHHRYDVPPRTNPFKNETTGLTAPFSVFHGRVYAPPASSSFSSQHHQPPSHQQQSATQRRSLAERVALPSRPLQQRSASAGAAAAAAPAATSVHPRFLPQQHQQQRSSSAGVGGGYFHPDDRVPERRVYHDDYDDTTTDDDAAAQQKVHATVPAPTASAAARRTTYATDYRSYSSPLIYAQAARNNRIARERLMRYSSVADEEGYFDERDDAAKWRTFVATVHRPVAQSARNRVNVRAQQQRVAARHVDAHRDDAGDAAAAENINDVSAITSNNPATAAASSASPRGASAQNLSSARTASPISYQGVDHMQADLEERDSEEALVQRPTLSPRGVVGAGAGAEPSSSPNASRSVSFV